MLDLSLILVSGLLGSSHCLGMCGPFVMLLGAGASGAKELALRQVAYSFGRVVTYALLGALVGGIGWRVGQSVPDWVNVSAILAIVAGCFLVYEGLVASGLVPARWREAGWLPCLSSDLLRSFLRSKNSSGALMAGAATGLLPCGLLYGFLTLAASTGSLWRGALVMVTFGLGTVPALALLGIGGMAIGIGARAKLLKVAAVCVIITGVISVGRGVGFFHVSAGEPTGVCPFCQSSENE